MMKYYIYVMKCNGNVNIHTFLGSESILANASHIIEGPNELIVVDGQIDIPSTQEFLNYINKLGKPVSRVYVSHAHIDHFVTLSIGFGHNKVYALEETIRVISEKGEEMRIGLKPFYGDNIPESLVIPNCAVDTGNEVIDGILLVFEHIVNAEAEHQLVIRLPELKILIAQDLVYSGVYLYFDTLKLDNWLGFLESILYSEYDVILSGHGKPADKKEVRANIDYLKTAAELAKRHYPDIAAFKSDIISAFPNRTVPILIDIHSPRLFANMAADKSWV